MAISTAVRPRIFKFVLFALLAGCLAAYWAANRSQDTAGPVATLAQVPGRNYVGLSVHPNSQELLFLEFRDDWPSASRLLRYHLGTQQLQYYALAPDYIYFDAAFSPSGNYIVLRRTPNVRGDDQVLRRTYAASEIAIMRADGTGFRVLPLSPGLKMAPVMSHDERHIAYWRATQRRPGSKSFADQFDVWEVDLQTGEDRPFAGLYAFFEGGQMQYFRNDRQIVFGTYLPTRGNVPGLNNDNFADWSDAYHKKHNNSFIYILERGADELPDPVNTGVSGTQHTSLDDAQNLYFTGDKPHASIFRMAKYGSLTQWDYPWVSMNQETDVVALPDGSGVAFVFYYKNGGNKRKGVALLDAKLETWTQISIPNFEEGVPIAISSVAVKD